MPADRPSWSEPTLGFLVHDVARLLRKRLEQRARAAGIGLSRAQWQVLANVARCEGINQAGLAGILDIEPITLARLLDRLELMGFVERRLDPRDRRQRNLFLTDRAWPELERVRQLGAEVREEALAGLDATIAAAVAGGSGRDQGQPAGGPGARRRRREGGAAPWLRSRKGPTWRPCARWRPRGKAMPHLDRARARSGSRGIARVDARLRDGGSWPPARWWWRSSSVGSGSPAGVTSRPTMPTSRRIWSTSRPTWLVW